jgi:SAM-dependent methyltransferase
MDYKKIKKVNDYYDKLLNKYGTTPSALGLPKGRQELRFKNIDKLFFSGCTILDYGCGFADLNKYLKKRFSKYKYTYSGCDIVPKFLEISKKLYPKVNFFDLRKKKIKKNFDITTAFGVFNLLYSKNQSHHFEIIKAKLKDIFSITNKYVLVDFQTPLVDYKQNNSYHQNVDILVDYIGKNLSRRFEIIHSYLPYEYSVIIYKEDKINENYNTFLIK